MVVSIRFIVQDMPVFPLPPVPNFRVTQGSPGFVRLNWADYPLGIKEGHALVGFRIYRSSTKDELGELIADEKILDPNAFQFDDTDPFAGPDRFYLIVAVEDGGSGETQRILCGEAHWAQRGLV